MKYVNQLEYPEISYITRTSVADEADREKGKQTTIKSSGCGLCAAIMVADRLLVDPDIDLEKLIHLSYEIGANTKKGTTYKIFAPVFAERYGLTLEMTNDPERLRCCLRTGGAAVLHSGGDREGHIGVFTHGGHYVTAISEEADGRIVILDPSYKPGKFDEEGRQGKIELRNEVFCLCDMQVILDDTANRDPGMYLFWRK